MNEQRKYEVIKGLVDHPDTANKDRAALILGCTKRHINRMIQGYIKDGKAFFIHGNRGKKPATTIRPDVRSQVIDLYRTKYYEANFEHYTELLKKHEGISISSSSVMSILESEYILSPKATKAKRRRIKQALRAKKQAATSKKELSQIQANLVAVEDAHSRRPRCAYFGELLQMDATPYEWVPGQIWHLHLAIDDASGVVTGAWFDTQETLNGYYHVFEQILTDYGIPYKFLTDKRTVFTYKKKGALSDDKDTYTQFAYACKQLGIQLESSSVPQAKGRIERLNQTLQSRLPIEFRLAGVTDINNANEFLYHYIKEFNEKFSLPCNGIKSVFEKQPSKEKINLTLAVLTERTVDAGHAIQFEKKFYKMVDNKGMQTHYRKGTKVMLIKAFDRSLFACVNDKDIYALEEIPPHEYKSKDLDSDYKQPEPRKPYIPPMNHPWRLGAFYKFVHSQPHRIEEDIKSA
ncbi:ISNCY family transposase [Lachnoanaerobaculum gingivalis]|uniref:ISNCY family transposase n=2 Tax=Lachnoanaerobaculum gingivalis TaxID=2490855 RepID=A0A3P3QW78_9FIRM|nr:ISNCY family transposase [Lachnoanaerobaculum gingivalis]RRJ24983.1 ISNCY family transposase [Lachnoanaerobaculum gingivalis]RRJ25471.1 ISNCY family transposase [Lachnoanaerobaculum gingivalis]